MTLSKHDVDLLMQAYDKIDTLERDIFDLQVAHDECCDPWQRYQIRLRISKAQSHLREVKRQASAILTMIP